jgi:uncharacterized protein YndB with AHSA1/START domain
MPDILHRIGMKASSPEAAYKALTAIDGLAGWWTTDTSGDGKPGGIIKFRFGELGGFDMKVAALEPGRHVLWEVVDGPAEWVGTKVGFDIRQDGDYTIVLFKHAGWKEPGEFMSHCSTKWAVFLMSLKSLLETGKGGAFPDDVQISDWH